MKNWKRNTVVATVLVFVCAGIYLNWSYNQNDAVADLSETLDATQVMGENLMLPSEDGLVETYGEANTITDYFATVRLSRQEARDGATELLQEAMAYGEGEDTSAATSQLNTIVTDALAESQIESLIIAKGYAECVAYMTDDEISVAVAAPEEGLSATDVALISDVVVSQSVYDLSQIRVIEVQ
ncbi:MAG: SpoIIIAH-like family protein [Eubacteriales bacterium]